jgi:CTP synthase (UTP-ammonia lyase)
MYWLIHFSLKIQHWLLNFVVISTILDRYCVPCTRCIHEMRMTMKDTVRIGLIGDFNPDVIAHIAIPQALTLAARKVECSVETEWLLTPLLEKDTASPYRRLHAGRTYA